MAVTPTAFATDADVLRWYPAIHAAVTAIDPDMVADMLTTKQCLFCAETWGCNLFRGHLTATVHCLKGWLPASMSTVGTPAGTVSSMREGPFSVTFANPGTAGGSGGDYWGSTAEGKEYLMLRDSLGPTPIIVEQGAFCRPNRGRLAL